MNPWGILPVSFLWYGIWSKILHRDTFMNIYVLYPATPIITDINTPSSNDNAERRSKFWHLENNLQDSWTFSYNRDQNASRIHGENSKVVASKGIFKGIFWGRENYLECRHKSFSSTSAKTPIKIVLSSSKIASNATILYCFLHGYDWHSGHDYKKMFGDPANYSPNATTYLHNLHHNHFLTSFFCILILGVYVDSHRPHRKYSVPISIPNQIKKIRYIFNNFSAMRKVILLQFFRLQIFESRK